jgi:hypothetical protein
MTAGRWGGVCGDFHCAGGLARLALRVHRPAVARLAAAPATDESPAKEECHE